MTLCQLKGSAFTLEAQGHVSHNLPAVLEASLYHSTLHCLCNEGQYP